MIVRGGITARAAALTREGALAPVDGGDDGVGGWAPEPCIPPALIVVALIVHTTRKG